MNISRFKNRIFIFAVLFFFKSVTLFSQTFTSSNLPIVIINTHGQVIINEPKITADMGIIYKGEGIRNNITDSINHYNGKIGIEIRGSSTQQFPKKQYGVETRDTAGNDLKVSLLGMPSESDWILSAQYNDKTLMRDVVTYSLVNSTGRYASRTKFFELVINGEYLGVYVLFEKIKRDKNRVNISKLDSTGITGDNLTGGYIIKVDKLDGSGNDGWKSLFPPYTGAWQRVLYQYHYPKPEDITETQKTYIKNYILNFETTMYMPAYNDTINGYSTVLDVSSTVDYFLINELTKNVDGYRLSFFMYKDKDSKNSKLIIGPVWDFNHGFGNSNYYNGALIEGWHLSYLTTNSTFKSIDQFQPPFWWGRLLQDDIFMGKVKLRWIDFRKNQFQLSKIYTYIDSLVAHLSESQQRNFTKWPILNAYVWPNAYIGGTYANEIAYMKNWIKERFNWMDIELTGSPLDVKKMGIETPSEFLLMQNYPNPFNPNTVIQFQLPADGYVSLAVYNILGMKVMDVFQGQTAAGSHSIHVDASSLSSGTYFYRLNAGSYSSVKKMILMK